MIKTIAETMEMRKLGTTDLEVSVICLGTMTWGQQNTEAEAHAQMDYALEAGVNFFDTAEMYPVPIKRDTQGRTEQYIGTWLAARGCRNKIILASKVAGASSRINWLRDGNHRLDRKNIILALEDSLRRLQTDYLDLYQLHWPDRNTNCFGELGYTHDPSEPENATEAIREALAETMSALDELVKSGKVRHVGLSNETPWGVMKYVAQAAHGNGPRPVSIQNPYSLLNRSFEVGLAEVAIREKVGLLAYSPLGFGMLTGKYENGAKPTGARLTAFDGYFDRYASPEAAAATSAYVQLARKHGLSPTQMALAFVNSRPFVTSNIIGATSVEQLKENIESASLTLEAAILAEIDAIHTRHPNPSP